MTDLRNPDAATTGADIPYRVTNYDTAPTETYDFHFAGGKVHKLWTNEICLMPFVPSKYAQRLSELFTLHPCVNNFLRRKIQTVPQVLEYCELKRADPTVCLWGIFLTPKAGKDPSPDELVGITGLVDYDSNTLTAEIGPLIIFPPNQSRSLGSRTTLLLLSYAFRSLGLVKILGRTRTDNAACNKVGEKSLFQLEYVTRGRVGYDNGPSWGALGEGDGRMGMKLGVEVTGSVFWDEFEGEVGVEEEEVGVDSAVPVFLNTLEGVRDTQEAVENHLEDRQPHLQSHVEEVQELESDFLHLVRFISAIHAIPLFTLLHLNRSQGSPLIVDGVTRGDRIDLRTMELKGFSEYMAENGQAPGACVWVIYEKGERKIKGFVLMHGDERFPGEKTSAVIGPLVIFDTNAKPLILQTMSLLLKHAFAPQPTGRGCTRVTYFANPTDPAIPLLQGLGFINDGVGRFPVRRDGAEEEGKKGRDGFEVVRVWIGSITWPEWEGGVKELSQREWAPRGHVVLHVPDTEKKEGHAE